MSHLVLQVLIGGLDSSKSPYKRDCYLGVPRFFESQNTNLLLVDLGDGLYSLKLT